MKQTLFIHAGCEKTATTTIQHFFQRNRQSILKKGVLYPQMGLRDDAQFNLVAGLHGLDNKSPLLEFYSDEPVDAGVQWQLLIKRFDARPNKNILVSAEHFSSRLRQKGIAYIADFLKSYDERIDVKIIFFIRRQDKFIESSYSTAIKAGANLSFDEFFEQHNQQRFRYNYQELLSLWEQGFGREAIQVVNYDNVVAHSGVLKKMCELIDVEWNDDYNIPEKENSSWSPKMLELARLCHHPRLKERISKNRLGILDELAMSESWNKQTQICLMSKAQRQSVMEFYAESNKAVAASYFSNQSENLFNWDDIEQQPTGNEGANVLNRIDLLALLLDQMA